MACWKIRSLTVGIPSFRIPPSGFGISTRLTGSGVYFPRYILSIMAFWFSRRYAPISSTVIPSIPGAPLFAFTLLKALFKLSLYSIFSKSSGCALSLSFHIRLKERCALTYPSCSALFFCKQLSLFSASICPSSFPGCTKDSYWFGPSSLDYYDLCWLLYVQHRLVSLYSGYSFQSIPYRPPRVPHASFSPSICHIYHAWFRAVIGLWLVWQPYPHT